jgi:hypothetical protein
MTEKKRNQSSYCSLQLWLGNRVGVMQLSWDCQGAKSRVRFREFTVSSKHSR